MGTHIKERNESRELASVDERHISIVFFISRKMGVLYATTELKDLSPRGSYEIPSDNK